MDDDDFNNGNQVPEPTADVFIIDAEAANVAYDAVPNNEPVTPPFTTVTLPENIAGPMFVNVPDPDTVNEPVIVILPDINEFDPVVTNDPVCAFVTNDPVCVFVTNDPVCAFVITGEPLLFIDPLILNEPVAFIDPVILNEPVVFIDPVTLMEPVVFIDPVISSEPESVGICVCFYLLNYSNLYKASISV